MKGCFTEKNNELMESWYKKKQKKNHQSLRFNENNQAK